MSWGGGVQSPLSRPRSCLQLLVPHIRNMADKKPAPPAATPAPAASSSAVVNPARAAVAEAKLDMSLGNFPGALAFFRSLLTALSIR